MDFSGLLYAAVLLVPFIALTEIGKLIATASAPGARKESVAVALGLARPWLYTLGLVTLIACSAVDMPWRAVIYVAGLVAIALLCAILAMRAKQREMVEEDEPKG